MRPKRLVWGLPLDLHVSFHCLAWGPEGDLYLDHGDPLLVYGDFNRPDHWGHWTLFTQPGETKLPYTGVGAVLRVRPDGSDLRRSSPAACAGRSASPSTANGTCSPTTTTTRACPTSTPRARLLHVMPHADFGWPRGWMASKSPTGRPARTDDRVPRPGRAVRPRVLR